MRGRGTKTGSTAVAPTSSGPTENWIRFAVTIPASPTFAPRRIAHWNLQDDDLGLHLALARGRGRQFSFLEAPRARGQAAGFHLRRGADRSVLRREDRVFPGGRLVVSGRCRYVAAASRGQIDSGRAPWRLCFRGAGKTARRI